MARIRAAAAIGTGSLLLLLSLDVFAQNPLGSPLHTDLEAGILAGRTALAVDPILPDGTDLDPAGFGVRLARHGNLEDEIGFPAGSWFQPPPGAYRTWVEGNWLISASSFTMRYQGTGPRGLRVASRVYPAGRARLSEALDIDSNRTLRILHTESHTRGEFLQAEMSRRLTGGRLYESVLMPEGKIIAGIFNNELQEMEALSRPVQVVAGEEVSIAPRPPSRATDLLVILERAKAANTLGDDPVTVLAGVDDEKPRAPDLTIETATRVTAVWYDLEGRVAEIEARSPTSYLAPKDVALREGHVESLRTELQLRPTLKVSAAVPQELSDDPASIRVHSNATHAVLREIEWPQGQSVVALESMEPDQVCVHLELGVWEFEETADLSDGVDAAVHFAPEPIDLHGFVDQGGTAQAGATLQFRSNRSGPESAQAVTDEDGRFHTVLFKPIHLVSIQLAGSTGPPFLEFLKPPITESSERIFHIPSGKYTVRVLDSTTAEPVEEAEVAARNAASDGRVASQGSRTDSRGTAQLQPLRPGEVEILVEADGYFSSDPLTRTVPEDSQGFDLDILLDPVGETTDLRLILASGQLATDAEVVGRWTIDHSSKMWPWSGRTNAEGIVEIPRVLDGIWLLIRHPQASSMIHRFEALHDGISLTLPNRGAPLSLRTVDASDRPIRGAALAVWIGDLRITGSVLAFLAGADSRSGWKGLWSSGALPPASTRVLAWKGSTAALAVEGGLDVYATPISYPWSQTVDIEVFGLP